MSTLQFIQITPEQLLEAIIAGVKQQLEILKKDFKPTEHEEYLTRHEVAKLLKCDISTVHNWTTKGKLKPYGIGNRVYYKRIEIEQCLIPIR
jgi:hypothetical protein